MLAKLTVRNAVQQTNVVLLQQRHFERFAKYIRDIAEDTDTRLALAQMVMEWENHQNPLFERSRFLRACDLEADR